MANEKMGNFKLYTTGWRNLLSSRKPTCPMKTYAADWKIAKHNTVELTLYQTDDRSFDARGQRITMSATVIKQLAEALASD